MSHAGPQPGGTLLLLVAGLSGCAMSDGEWEAQAGAEASAKVGEGGATGGGGAGACDRGYSIHVITDAGVSATATAGIIHLKMVKLKKWP